MPPNHYAIARIPFHLKHYIFDNFRENPAIIVNNIVFAREET